ncbi:nucleotide sugar dehydrogenase [Kutzneria kofuensis]|uniref:Nucleotide sugar dehydrogenase n=1 Tax=Kutzneria kofuensis TaxID=103725 RepID=A0A7W9KEU5_9PSEU|nr:nucleotide sugar dehydrogenase [Kutzneria kofuensis]MBB5891330.1 nucleotide sugar dehydrogenase [Kutzneria kofuensis]
MDSQHVVMVGIGYAGLPLAVALARAGNQVTGLDIDAERVRLVNAGVSPVDTVRDEDIRELAGNLRATTDSVVIADCDVVVVCAPTPVVGNTPDLGPLTAAITTVRDRLRPGQLVVVESTTHPSTTDGLLLPILEQSGLRAGVDFNLAYSPERIDPGNQRFGITTTPRVVGGLTAVCTERAAALYRQVTEVHVAKGIREAEAAKILENTYRQVNIALVNEFAQLCHGMDIDVWDVIEAASTKPYGFKTFWPGAGVGGHCIPADPLYLVHHAASLGLSFQLAEIAHQVNESMPVWVADRIVKDLSDRGLRVDGATVLLVGVAYKPDTADTRHSPAGPIARFLQERGVRVVFHDPLVDEFSWPGGRIEPVADLAAALAEADTTALLQRHQVLDLDLVCDHARRLFDTTGAATTAAIKL